MGGYAHLSGQLIALLLPGATEYRALDDRDAPSHVFSHAVTRHADAPRYQQRAACDSPNKHAGWNAKRSHSTQALPILSFTRHARHGRLEDHAV